MIRVPLCKVYPSEIYNDKEVIDYIALEISVAI